MKHSTLDNGLAGVLNVSSNSSNAVHSLNQPADTSYNQTQIQDVLSKFDGAILALRRQFMVRGGRCRNFPRPDQAPAAGDYR